MSGKAIQGYAQERYTEHGKACPIGKSDFTNNCNECTGILELSSKLADQKGLINVQTLELNKLESSIIYLIRNAPETLSRTKLVKLLYLADLMSLKKHKTKRVRLSCRDGIGPVDPFAGALWHGRKRLEVLSS